MLAGLSTLGRAYSINSPAEHALLSCCTRRQALADLFALDRIYGDIAFRNDDYIAPEKSKAIQRLIEQLCSEVRPVTFSLVWSGLVGL